MSESAACPQCGGEQSVSALGDVICENGCHKEPSAASVAFTADPIAVVVYDYGSKISDEPTMTVFGPFAGWNEARDYRDKIRPEREAACVVMRDPSIWPEPEKAL